MTRRPGRAASPWGCMIRGQASSPSLRAQRLFSLTKQTCVAHMCVLELHMSLATCSLTSQILLARKPINT